MECELQIASLQWKADEMGLSDGEAAELGRLLADRAGRSYSSAEERPHPDLYRRRATWPVTDPIRVHGYAWYAEAMVRGTAGQSER